MTTTTEKKKSSSPALVNESGSIRRAFSKLRKDRIAFIATLVLLFLYLVVFMADFLAPYSTAWYDREFANASPTPIYVIDAETRQPSWPYVFRYEKKFDTEAYEYRYLPAEGEKYYLQFLTTGESYKIGPFKGNLHLFGVEAPARIALLGNDINGRDNFSRLLFGGRISLTIGFLSLFIAFPIGLVYGGISGYFGGRVDNLMMRFAEVIMSIPSLYLLISLAAILPPGLSSTQRFAMIVMILALIGWAGLSRIIRGMVLSIKNMEFVEAERAIGLQSLPIIIRHILPQTASFVIVAMTVGVPGYILAESGLSFLGLGIQQPDASWGNMLKEAQEITNLMNRPWMLMPGVLIFIAVLAFNVIGDAIRDVLDPKSTIRR